MENIENGIIKALENCLDYSPSCTICKYDADTLTSSECMGALMKDSLDLINRQKAEILELQKRIINWRTDMDYRPDEIKSEAIKEFAERFVNEKCAYCTVDTDEMVFFKKDIDKLVKEMTE